MIEATEMTIHVRKRLASGDTIWRSDGCYETLCRRTRLRDVDLYEYDGPVTQLPTCGDCWVMFFAPGSKASHSLIGGIAPKACSQAPVLAPTFHWSARARSDRMVSRRVVSGAWTL